LVDYYFRGGFRDNFIGCAQHFNCFITIRFQALFEYYVNHLDTITTVAVIIDDSCTSNQAAIRDTIVDIMDILHHITNIDHMDFHIKIDLAMSSIAHKDYSSFMNYSNDPTITAITVDCISLQVV